MDRILRSLVRRGVREALRGGSGPWLAVGAGAFIVRFLRKAPKQKVIVEELAAGQRISVTHVPPPPFGRAARKLARPERILAREARTEIERERAGAEPRPEAGRRKR
ncbi:MAG: hypothetical protein ACRDZ5_04025 [Acidimicrobiales bacterium]